MGDQELNFCRCDNNDWNEKEYYKSNMNILR